MKSEKTMRSSNPSFNLFDPEFLFDPFPIYDLMRESAPVYWFEPARLWYATRHDDVENALKDARRFSSRRTQNIIDSQVSEPESDRYEPLTRTLSNWMVLKDPPEHTRSRAVVAKAFTSRAVEQMRPRIEEIVERLLDRVERAGRMDVVLDYAGGIPIAVIAGISPVAVTRSISARS